MNSSDAFLQANTAYDAGDFPQAFELFLNAAVAGDCLAMCRVALMYEAGEGVVADAAQSIHWDLKAIEAGCTSSLINLGITYRNCGDVENAKRWFEKSWEAGDGEAALELAKLYIEINDDMVNAKKYLDAAMSSDNLTENSIEEVRALRTELDFLRR